MMHELIFGTFHNVYGGETLTALHTQTLVANLADQLKPEVVVQMMISAQVSV